MGGGRYFKGTRKRSHMPGAVSPLDIYNQLPMTAQDSLISTNIKVNHLKSELNSPSAATIRMGETQIGNTAFQVGATNMGLT